MKLWTLSPQAQDFRDRKLKTAIAGNGKKLSECSDYEIDMWCFNRHPWKHERKWEFLVRAMQGQWGDLIMFENTVNGTRYENYWALRVAKEMCISPIIDLMGSGSSGKTHMATCCGYTIWKSAPYNTSVYLSTTTGEGADARAWATVNQIFRDDKNRFGKMINSTRTLVIEEESEINEENAKFRDMRNAIKCVLIPTGNEGKNVVGAISGRKNNRVIWICDEFPHMDLGVLKGRTNLMTNVADRGWAQFVGCGNGPEEGDPLFIDAEPLDGWPSIDKDTDYRWETRSGVCLYFNGDKSPNLQAPRGARPPFPRIIDWEVRDLILKNCWSDENTPEFWKQFFGFPPSVKVAITVLTKAFLKNHGSFEMADWFGDAVKTLAGLDLGFKKDGDPSVIQIGKLGKDTRNKTVLEFQGDGKALLSDVRSKEEFNKQIAEKVLKCCSENGCHDLALDVTGDGGILLQEIEKEARSKQYALNCLPVSFSGTAEDKIVIPGEKRKAKDMYDRMVSQIWGQVRHSVGNKVIRGVVEHGKATDQFCQRKFKDDEKKRFSIEKKEEMKLRIKRSPDHADAAALCVYLALKHGLSGKEESTEKPKPPVNPLEKAKTQGYSSHPAGRKGYSGWR